MTSEQSRKSYQLVHIAVWAVFFALPLFGTNPRRPMLTWSEYLRFLIAPLSFLVVFYLNFLCLIDRTLLKKRVARFFSYNVLLIAGVMLATHFIMFYCFDPDPRYAHRPAPLFFSRVMFFARNVFMYLLVVGVSVAIKVTHRWYSFQAEKNRLEASRKEAELQNLKNQINPHFLFNTLNNIYSLIQIDTDKAQKAVHDLGTMLRYVLYESSHPYVTVKAEMDFVSNYIELMKIRLPEHVRLTVAMPQNPSQDKIAPLIFISLIENAFKHGVSNSSPSFINIFITQGDRNISCIVSNSVFPKDSMDNSGSGIGIANLKKRLMMIYPGRHVLDFHITENEYTATLSIDI